MASSEDSFFDNEEKKPEVDETSTEEIPEETLIEILSRLPFDEVSKIRSVSKAWSNFTRDRLFTDKYTRSTTITGFFYQERAYSYIDDKYVPTQPLFAPIEPERTRIPDPCFNFLKHKNISARIQVIDSCNGLLLCTGSRVGRLGLVKTWFVCNPITMEQLALPYPHRQSYSAIYALNAGLNSSGYLEFKVLCVFGPKRGEPNSKLSIFSSETGEWEEVEECLPPVCAKALMGSKVFFNGRLLWDCLEGYILISYLNSKNRKRLYELLETPQAPLGRFLWTYEDKIRCYCHGFPDEYPAWSIRLDDYKNKPMWELENCKEFENLSKDICGWLTVKETIPFIRYKMISYAPKSDEFFLFFAGSIYSYGRRNRSFKAIWAHPSPPQSKFYTTTRIIPYVHCLARIQKLTIRDYGADLVQEDSYQDKVESAANNTKPTRRRKMKTTLSPR